MDPIRGMNLHLKEHGSFKGSLYPGQAFSCHSGDVIDAVQPWPAKGERISGYGPSRGTFGQMSLQHNVVIVSRTDGQYSHYVRNAMHVITLQSDPLKPCQRRAELMSVMTRRGACHSLTDHWLLTYLLGITGKQSE